MWSGNDSPMTVLIKTVSHTFPPYSDQMQSHFLWLHHDQLQPPLFGGTLCQKCAAVCHVICCHGAAVCHMMCCHGAAVCHMVSDCIFRTAPPTGGTL